MGKGRMLRRRFFLVCLTVALLLLHTIVSADPIITTVAGGGPDNVPATSASIGKPGAIAVDADGNLFIPAEAQSRVFKVDTTGHLTIAGMGAMGFGGNGGPAPMM